MSKCHVIIELHCMGVSNSMIIKQLKVPKSTVCNTVARFKELGDDKDRPRSGCPCTAHTPKIIKAVCERVTPTRQCSFPHVQKNSSMVQSQFSEFLEQGNVAPCFRFEFSGLQYLVDIRG